MKKSVLILALLGAAASAHAQAPHVRGPWTEVNFVNPVSAAPGFRIDDIVTVSENVAWALAREDNANSKSEYFFRTLNPAGTEFDFNAISAPGSNTAYNASNIAAVSATTALVSRYGSTGGGEILGTIDGGLSWTLRTAASDFTAGGGFLDFVYMFDANVGVAVGDPTNGYFEIRRTTDGGLTWTRIGSQPSIIPAAGEAGLTGSYFGLGNTIWFGGATLDNARQEYVYKSVDRGVTWTRTANPTPLTASINRFAFIDQMNGIAYNQKSGGTPVATTAVNVIRTSDGGATWSTITPANGPTGSFYRYAIDAVDGRYYSSGQRFPSAAANADFGFSSSPDGVNWTNLVVGGAEFFAFDLISGATANMPTGYAGLSTTADGIGGIYKTTNVLPTRDAALQSALSAYPNPSASGVFSVNLGATLKAGALVTVVDALGRQVKSQTLSAATVGAQRFSLDLSGQKTGVYTLQIRTAGGIATQKLVVE